MKIIGDGGHAKVVRQVAHNAGWDAEPDSPQFWFIAVGDNASRKRESHDWGKRRYARLIDPSAMVSDSAEIGEGTIIMAGAIVGPSAKIGAHCIVNHGATCDHDVVLGDYVHIAPGAHLCGHVEVGEGSLVGVGVGIAPGCKIPAWTLVRARRLEMEPLYAV